MQPSDIIVRAIAAHARWKFYLRRAIESGQSDWDVQEAGTDTKCEFGQWLRTLAAGDRNAAHLQEVRQLHAEFHEQAAEVLRLALAGDREAAESAMAQGSRFDKVTTKLTLAMTAWRKALDS
jgi:hypothetical protein